MLFRRKKKLLDAIKKIDEDRDKIKLELEEPKPLEEITALPKEEPKIEEPKEENSNTIFVTTDPKLVFSLQDKFTVKSVFYDKHNNGIKTFVFNATEGEIDRFLKEEK